MRRLFCIVFLVLLFPGPATADEIVVEVDNLRLEFTQSGELREVVACLPACTGQQIHQRTLGDAVGLLDLGEADGPMTLSREDSAEAITLHFDSAEGTAYRHWRIPRSGWRVELAIGGMEGVKITGSPAFRPREAAGFGAWLEQPRYLTFEDGDIEVIPTDEVEPDSMQHSGWLGFRDRFWSVMLKASRTVSVTFEPLAPSGDGGDSATGPALSLAMGDTTSEWSFYFGPVEPRALRSAAPELHQMMYASLWFWLRWICDGLYWLLAWIQAFIPSWGFAIMALSVAVHFLMRPLSAIADRLQNDVHRIEARVAPELNEIKRKYRGEEQSKRVLALYKAHGVNPFYSVKSLAGVAVVIPVFIGAFDMLAENIWLAETTFLWIDDLSQPDRLFPLPFEIPFFGAYLNLLPFVMTGLSVLASALHRHEDMDDNRFSHHRRNLVLMALAFLALFYTFPAGMVLYWTTNNLMSVVKYGLQSVRHQAQQD